MYLLAAISIGFLGSVHCAGMCGPILLAVNQGRRSWKYDALHHSGRIFTYIMFGTAAGALGNTFSLMGWQQGFSIVVGSLLLLSVFLMLVGKQFHTIEKAISRLAIKFSAWVHGAGLGHNQLRLLGGVGNGILPCGLVYLAVAGAANTFTPWDGALFMLAFGLGTLPMLIFISQFAHLMTPNFRSRLRRFIPITVFAMGLLLIARGANLGIPYLSPLATESGDQVTQCD